MNDTSFYVYTPYMHDTIRGEWLQGQNMGSLQEAGTNVQWTLATTPDYDIISTQKANDTSTCVQK
jgi:hypothetical protein